MPFKKGDIGNPEGKGGFKKGELANPGFKKGVSGNPKGRPPISKEIKAILREGTPKVVTRLLRMIMADETEDKIRLLAIREWLDRDLGKIQPTLTMPGTPIGYSGDSEAAVIILPSNGYEVDISLAGSIPKSDGEQDDDGNEIDLEDGEYSEE